jgi:hypothetical protein
VLALTPSEPSSVSPKSFVVALSVQLHPYGLDLAQRSWSPPAALEEQVRRARKLGRRRGARWVVWYSVRHAKPSPHLSVHVLQLVGRQAGHWTMPLGPPGAGVERSMAAAARTLLLAPAGRSAAADGATGAGGAGVWRHRLRIGTRYSVDIFPVGDEIRHGPDLLLHLRLWSRVEGSVGLGFRLPTRDSGTDSSWSRSFLALSLAAGTTWSLSPRWQVAAGGGVRVTGVAAEAHDASRGRRDSDVVWEVALGPAGEARLWLGHRFSLSLGLEIDWVVLEHRLFVRGSRVARSGPLQVTVAPALGVHLW